MANTDERNFPRVKKKTTFKITPCENYKRDGLWVTITSVNISKTGILFESPEYYSIGQEYIIRFTGNDNKLHDEKIKIVRTKEIVTGTCYSIGAKFTDTDSEKITALIS